MAIYRLKLSLLTLITATLALSSTTTAHASWVSRALGLDHHSNPTPTPVTIIQPVYIQPITLVAAAPIPNPTPAATPYATPTPNTVAVLLPVTGPTSTVMWPALIAAIFAWAAALYVKRLQARRAIRNIDIV